MDGDWSGFTGGGDIDLIASGLKYAEAFKTSLAQLLYWEINAFIASKGAAVGPGGTSPWRPLRPATAESFKIQSCEIVC